MTASIATRRQFGEVTRWQEHRLKRFGVEIILNTEATRETVLSLDPDAVIVATGSLPRKTGYSGLRPDVREIPGAGGPNVLSVWDVFDPNVRVAQQVLVVDDDPHFCGAYVAEHLADHGHAVHLATSQLHPLPDLPANFVPALYRRLVLKGIHISTNAILSGIGPDHVFLTDRFSSEVRRIDNLPNVVLSMGNESNNGLHHALRDKVGELYAIGDCVTPRRIDDAILDGERAGWML
jgi:hypothetical protein